MEKVQVGSTMFAKRADVERDPSMKVISIAQRDTLVAAAYRERLGIAEPYELDAALAEAGIFVE